jgi:hypothetical protein
MADSSDYSSDDSSVPTQTKGRKSKVLEDILDKLGPADKVSYTPFKTELPQDPVPRLPPSFPSNPYPFDYFSLFFTPDLFKTITKNTNTYAGIYRIRVLQENAREWSNLLLEELYVFIGVVLYMGVHYEPQIELYWNSDFNKGPLHTITAHIGLCRFEQIKHYCHISCPESDERNNYHLPTNKTWWYKLEPLASSIQASCRKYYSPSSYVSIDKVMVRFFGR